MRVLLSISVLVVLLAGFFFITKKESTSQSEPPATSSASWAYAFVVWNNHIYKLSSERVGNIGERIGSVESYSSEEIDTYKGNFSNKYPIGTPYYEIPDTAPETAIAVYDGDAYFKAFIEREVLRGK
ncbi:hypothetical protein [Brevibacillus sp. NRS-1366]|uniref:hypothetical protein n=1 Tax=Brevibacillus sp. NRS-1366 TaxID=3233899 RepID=UPI003D242A41